MKIKYLKFTNWLLVSAMSLFGLSACHCHKETPKQGNDGGNVETPRRGIDDRAVPMYGVRPRDYKVEAIDSLSPKEMPQPREPQVTVYGVPTVDFSVKGRVVDNDGKPVKGLQVMLINSDVDPDHLPDNPYWKERMKNMSDTTDSDGNFEVRTTDRPWETVRVMVRDIDDDKNGNFEKKLVEVEFGEPQPTGAPVSSWKLGEKKAEISIKVNRE